VTAEVTFKPIDPAWPEARKAAGIDLALRSGSTWQQVAAALGLPGKREAKRYRRELEHQVRLRQLAG
jgi:hypothetical protein